MTSPLSGCSPASEGFYFYSRDVREPLWMGPIEVKPMIAVWQRRVYDLIVDVIVSQPAQLTPTYNDEQRCTGVLACLLIPSLFSSTAASPMMAMVGHYNRHFRLNPADGEKRDLVEYLKSP